MEEQKKQKQGGMLAGTVLIMLIIAAVAAIAVYAVQQAKIDSLSEEIGAVERKAEDEEKKYKEEKEELEESLADLRDEIFQEKERKQIAKQKTFKDFVAITAEIPETWSMFVNPSFVGDSDLANRPTSAISAGNIQYGDWNAEQIDFYYAKEDIVDKLFEAEKEIEGAVFTTENIAGLTASVVTYEIEKKGEPTKEKTGGKKYFLRLNNDYVKTLVIVKQAELDAEFEESFDTLTSRMQISSN